MRISSEWISRDFKRFSVSKVLTSNVSQILIQIMVFAPNPMNAFVLLDGKENYVMIVYLIPDVLKVSNS